MSMQPIANEEHGSDSVLERIRAMLREANVDFRELRHAQTLTSQDSAAARNEDLSVGAKALLVKIDGEFHVLVLAADRKLDSAAVKRKFGSKRMRFASVEELEEKARLVPGSVPPFGRPILPFELFADDSIGANVDRMAFNAGSLTDSIVMSVSDWETVAKPSRFSFSK